MPSALLILVLSAAAPLFARGSQDWFGLAPCELCIWQRWPYAVAALFALVAVFGFRRPALRLAGLAAAASAAVAAFHLGVEWGWWPSPLAGCQAPSVGSGSVDDLLAAMAHTAPSKPCDLPAYLIPGLPLSMAGMNLIYGTGVAVLAFILAQRENRA
ncbi:disulfide bond formation protein B [Roseococcus sp. YIM B11640]|uniref:disulfide bond formation protein B n=1 Tax=Roseococcus sp. YIM B11640 TaxID=3133973 RepID=UPI003C7AABB6